MLSKRLTPHDHFFKKTLGEIREVGRDFCKQVLPKSRLKEMDLRTLTPHPVTLIDETLRKQEADILYSVNFRGKPSYIYVLIEHASTPDSLLPVRMIRYMIALLERHYNQKSSKKSAPFPYIYPIILYTGKRPFHVSLDFFELFGEEKDLARETFFNPCHLVNIREMRDEDLMSFALFSTAAVAAKHIYDKDFLPAFQQHLIPLLKILEDRGFKTYIECVISYFCEAGETPKISDFIETIQKGMPTIKKERLMTIAEQLRREGRKEGKKEMRQEIAQHLLAEGFPAEKIIRWTKLSVSEIAQLQKKH